MKLVTFLGKGDANRTGHYKDSIYDIDGHCVATPFFGLALAEALKVSEIIVLGTTGSMWDVFFSHRMAHLNEQQRDLLPQLQASVQDESVTSSQLDAVAAALGTDLGCTFRPRLVPRADTAPTQIELLKIIDDALMPGDEIAIDITHAYRHLPMIALTSAILLRKTKKVKVSGMYYGARDMTPSDVDAVTPVVRLEGLLYIFDWIEALAGYDHSRDYGALADVVRRAVSNRAYLGDKLAAAAFSERIGRIERAAEQLSEVRDALSVELGGPLELFRPALRERLAWSAAASYQEKQRQLALHYLHVGDYLRAGILGLEAHVTRFVPSAGAGDRYAIRDKAFEKWRKDQQAIRDSRSGSWGKLAPEPDPRYDAYLKLNELRNALAHHTSPHDAEVRNALQSQERLRPFMEQLFHHLELKD